MLNLFKTLSVSSLFFLILLPIPQTQGTTNLCNSTIFFAGFPADFLLIQVKYSAIWNDQNLDGSKSKNFQIFAILASTPTYQNGTLVLVNLYTLKIFKSLQEQVSDFLVLPNMTLIFLGESRKKLKMMSGAIIGKPFTNEIRSFVWANSLNRYFVVDSNTKNIYDQNGVAEVLSQNDTNILNSYTNDSSFTKIIFDDIYSELYLVLGSDVLVYDPVIKRIWYRFRGHSEKIIELQLINSTIPDKFCLISISYDKESWQTILMRWQPFRLAKNQSGLYDENQFYLYKGIYNTNGFNSVAKVFRQEFLVLSLVSATSNNTDIIIITSTDFSNGNSFSIQCQTVCNSKVSGDVEDTDIFYVYRQSSQMRQYSIFAEFPNCAKCYSDTKYWFYPFLLGCSNSCDRLTRQNYPFCEPRCNSQTYSILCDTSNNYGVCDLKYNTVTRFAIQPDCTPKIGCIDTNYYILPNNSCGLCDASCQTCVGSSKYQCLSCYPGMSYHVATSSCDTFCQDTAESSLITQGASVAWCFPTVKECPNGNYTSMYPFPDVSSACKHQCSTNCESCYGSANNCTSCSNNLILFNNKCVDVCPQGYYYGLDPTVTWYRKTCMSCSGQCVNCNLPCAQYNCKLPRCQSCLLNNTCEKCIPGYFVYNGTCVDICPTNFFGNNDTGLCQELGVCSSNCKSCSSNEGCTECFTGFLVSNRDCVACDSSCVNCVVDKNFCTSCRNTSWYLQKADGTCVEKCKAGTFGNDQTKICDSCSPTCVECSNLYNNCTVCDVQSYIYRSYHADTKTYFCSSCGLDHFYPSPSGDCLECKPHCKTCTTATDCLVCDPFYQQNYLNNTCEYCNSNCSYCQPLNFSRCDVCSNTSEYANPETGECWASCPSGYFIDRVDPKSCRQCSFLCKTCQSTIFNCTSCNSPDEVLLYNQTSNKYSCESSCPIGYFNDSTTKTCQACNQTCSHCRENSSNCIACQSPYSLYRNTCYSQCPIGTYQDIAGHCAICDWNCATCDKATNNCTSCHNPLVLSKNTCVMPCQLGYYSDQGQCKKCFTGCVQCNSLSDCSYCDPQTFSLKNGICVSTCGDGYCKESFQVNDSIFASKCSPCPSGCKICSVSNACQLCLSSDDFIDSLGNCISSCDLQNSYVITANFSYNIGSNLQIVQVKYCKKCSSLCRSCYGNQMNCTRCPTAQFLYQLPNSAFYACQSHCPDTSGYYILKGVDVDQCLPCDEGCSVCQGSICQLCSVGYYLGPSNVCLLQCPEYYVPNDNQRICLTCVDNQYIFPFGNGSFTCVDDCSSYGVFVYNETRSFCRNCSEHCKKCVSESYCIECENRFKKNLISQKCEANCLDGYYFKDSKCHPCSIEAHCATCDIAAEGCTSCMTSYFLKSSSLSSFSSCWKCDDACLTCLNVSSNCMSCPSGKFLLNNQCVEKVCPLNCSECLLENMTHCTSCKFDLSLIDGSCVVKSCPQNCSDCLQNSPMICTSCNEGYKMFNATCYNPCPVKTYESNNHSTCIECSIPNCFLCSSAEKCTQCMDGHMLSSYKCVNNCDESQFLNVLSNECSNCSMECSLCFGPDPNSCLACASSYYLKGTTCKSSCEEENECPLIKDQEIFDYVLVKSDYDPTNFYMMFSTNVEIPQYVNLNQLLNISIDNVDPTDYNYTVEKVDNKQDSLLIKVSMKASVKSPVVHVELTENSKDYIKGPHNTTLIITNSTTGNNITLNTILISSESKDTKEIKKDITNGTFVSFSYLFLTFCIATYCFDPKRRSIFWFLTDFMQVVSLLIFFKLNYDDRFVTFLQLLFVYHADFIAFLGKKVNSTTGEVSYFDRVLNNKIKDNEFGNNFSKYLGTNIFIANGLNAFLIILSIIILIIVIKVYIIVHKKINKNENTGGIFGIVKYFYEYFLFSIFIRVNQFFFYLIMTATFVQFYSLDIRNKYNIQGILLSISALIYYLCFFCWLSRKVVNNKETYLNEEERWKYDSVFHFADVNHFFSRNHFILLHIRKFLIVLGISTLIDNVRLLVIYLLVIQIVAMLRFAKFRPYTSFRMNCLDFVKEFAFFIIICILFKIQQVTEEQQNGGTVISPESQNSIVQAGDAIISFTFIVLVFYSIVGGLLLLFYVIKNIDCVCFFLMHQKMPEEDESTLESFEAEQRVKEARKNEDSKYKIPKKKNLRDIADQEEQWQKDLEAYKKEHIVKVG